MSILFELAASLVFGFTFGLGFWLAKKVVKA